MAAPSKLASRCREMNSSAIRELLKSLTVPGMISFAGGIPATESFPVEIVGTLLQRLLRENGPGLLQYGITEGYQPLRAVLCGHVKIRGIECTPEELCISTGAQGAIDAAAKILIDPGDVVAVEAPTFLAALNVFKSYEARIVEIPSDDDGIIPEEFEKLLQGGRVKLTYLIPTFQNPSGRTLSLERRHAVAALLKRFDTLVLEDDPYYELRYQGERLPALKNLAPENVIHVGSLSKILSPGLRLGYYIAPAPYRELMTTSRQVVDVHANIPGQAVAAEYLAGGHLATHLPSIIALYSGRLHAMLAGLKERLPEGFSYSTPSGGMFVWVTGPHGFDAQAAYQRALEHKVAFVPGHNFFADRSHGRNTFRLNFTAVPEDRIRAGLEILGKVLRAA